MSNITAEVYFLVKYQVGFQYYGTKGVDGLESIVDRVEKEAIAELEYGEVSHEEFEIHSMSISDENGLLYQALEGISF